MAALLILLLLIVLIPAGLHFRSSPPSFHELLTNAAKAPSRWPLTAFAAIAGTALAIARICGGAEGEFYGRLLALLVFNIPLSYALAFFAVRLGFSRWCTQGWTLALCAGASFWIYSALPAVFAALIMLIGIAAVLLALAAQPPYREHNNLRYLSECHHLQCIFAVSGLSSTLLAVGVCTILLSISYLFDLRIGGEPYGVVWAVCLIFITTAVFLGLAATSPGEQHAEFIPGPLSGIKDYVVVPLLLVYTLILYIYGAVIGATLTLPKGLIGWMVSSYALLGLFVWLASYPPEAHRTASVKFFYRRFFLLLAPLLLLLAAGLWTRINQYGVTEERYYLALFALWLACASACFLRRAEMSLRFLPASLLVLILISCAGPWSAFSVSRQSQLKRWAKHLEEAGVMPPAFAKPQNKSPLQPQRELSRICEYLSAIYGKHVFRQFFKENTEVLRAIEQASDPLRYDFLSEFRRADFCEALLPALGLRYVQPYEGQSKSLNLNVNWQFGRSYTTAGYSYIFLDIGTSYTRPAEIAADSPQVQLKDDSLIVHQGGREIGRIAFFPALLERIEELRQEGKPLDNLPQHELALDLAAPPLRAKLFFRNVSIADYESKPSLSHAVCDVLLEIDGESAAAQ